MRLRKALIRTAIVAPLALAAAAGSAWLVLTLGSRRGVEVAVPDLRGLEVGAAVEAASRKELAVSLSGYAYHPTVPPRHVISQSPEAGGNTRKNRILRVVLSRGSRDLAVPDLAAMDQRRASLTLTQTGLAVGQVSWARVPGTVAGAVAAQAPPPGTLLSRGETVDLLVSEGAPVPLLLMPELSPLSLPDALRFLRGLGLAAGTITSQGREDFPAGTVISTSPAGGHPVAAGGTVEITVSSSSLP